MVVDGHNSGFWVVLETELALNGPWFQTLDGHLQSFRAIENGGRRFRSRWVTRVIIAPRAKVLVVVPFSFLGRQSNRQWCGFEKRMV